MADPKTHDDPNSTHRITPRTVPPEDRTPAGGRDRSTSDDRGLRREPIVEEADGGDVAGVAGGSVDSKV